MELFTIGGDSRGNFYRQTAKPMVGFTDTNTEGNMHKFLVAGLVVLAGCARSHDVTVDDIRAADHKRAEGEIAMGIPQIQQAMQNYGSTCESLGPVTINPSNPGRAIYTGTTPGLTDSSAAILIDLQQVGTTTRYQGYTYYKTGQDQLNKVLYVMGGGRECRR